MSRILLTDTKNDNQKLGKITSAFVRKIGAFSPGVCPVGMLCAYLTTSAAQTCGKCVPCRDGLAQCELLLRSVLDGTANADTLSELERLLCYVRDNADCALGWNTAATLLEGLETFRDDVVCHIEHQSCNHDGGLKIPCMELCPAHVDVPGYIALTAQGKFEDAINLIRQDNPLPTACALICEHPCETHCRRTMLDAPINIRGIKKYAVDALPADRASVPKAMVKTGRSVAIVGGGPSGLTAAWFLSLMGHSVTIYDANKKLGGMLRYGIPNYRFPRERLDEDIRAILSAGDITVHTGVCIGRDIPVCKLKQQFDAVYVAIGAQSGRNMRIPGEDAANVVTAIKMLHAVGDGMIPDYSGKNVVVVGGGNVAMDCARSAIRFGAKSVCVAYRRRRADMTALPAEVDAACEEGVELITLQAPKEILKDENGNCKAIVLEPQMIGPCDAGGRPAPVCAGKEDLILPADVILVAVSQSVVTEPFEQIGMEVRRGTFVTGLDTKANGVEGIFAGGDCATGPATAIRAIAAGKVAAVQIDEYLGYHHKLPRTIHAPDPQQVSRIPTGRVEVPERPASVRKHDMDHVELSMCEKELCQEAGRCLRCDCFGNTEGGESL